MQTYSNMAVPSQEDDRKTWLNAWACPLVTLAIHCSCGKTPFLIGSLGSNESNRQIIYEWAIYLSYIAGYTSYAALPSAELCTALGLSKHEMRLNSAEYLQQVVTLNPWKDLWCLANPQKISQVGNLDTPNHGNSGHIPTCSWGISPKKGIIWESQNQ